MMMMHAKTDSDETSDDLSSSPRSPKSPVHYYYVNSPSWDSHDASSNIPMESPRPSHHSYTTTTTAAANHSRASSDSRISGSYYNSAAFAKKGNRKRDENGWSDDRKVIDEEGGYGYFYHDRKELSWRTNFFIAIIGFVLIFSFFCYIIWAASLHYRPQLSIKSLTVHNFHFGQGSDRTGVLTNMLTVNCSIGMTVHNPAPFFDIYVSSNSVNLMYSELTVATGELKKYHQRAKSLRPLTVNLQGSNVPLYGAGPSFLTDFVDNGKIPWRLVFEVKSCGYVIGKLVRTKHSQHVSCLVVIDSHNNKAIKFEENACSYMVFV